MANKLWVGGASAAAGDWSEASNWSPSGVPEANDNVTLRDNSQDIDDGLDQSAIRLATLNIEQSYTGKIETALQIQADTINIGQNFLSSQSPAGSSKLVLALGTNGSGEDVPVVNIYNSGTPSSSTNKPAIELTGEFNLNVRKGSVGCALGIGETAVIASLQTGYVTSAETDVKLFLGSGVTLSSFTQIGGTNIIQCGLSTLEVILGTLTIEGSGAIGTIALKGGNIKPHSTGAITTLTITNGHANFLGSSNARTVSTLNISGAGQISLDPDVVTISTFNVADACSLRASSIGY